VPRRAINREQSRAGKAARRGSRSASIATGGFGKPASDYLPSIKAWKNARDLKNKRVEAVRLLLDLGYTDHGVIADALVSAGYRDANAPRYSHLQAVHRDVREALETQPDPGDEPIQDARDAALDRFEMLFGVAMEKGDLSTAASVQRTISRIHGVDLDAVVTIRQEPDIEIDWQAAAAELGVTELALTRAISRASHEPTMKALLMRQAIAEGRTDH
jgi:hypothetical protein